MKCRQHQADACHDCRPAVRAAWTVGQLKAALAAIPDETPLVVNAVDAFDPEFVDPQVIVDAGFGLVDWGDGYGLEQSTIFGLECEIPEGELETRPERPPRLNPHREPITGPQAEPEAGR